MRSHLRSRALVAGVAALALITAAACSSNDDDDDAAEMTRLPLLGTEGDVPDRAALAIKIDNTERGRPQTAINDADVVFEEMVEGGLTRLLAVYHAEEPDTVGPVRSARSTDLDILSELGRPAFAWSGANPTFAAAVEAANLIDVGASAVPGGYERTSDRSAPFNLYASPSDLWDAAKDDSDGTTPPQILFDYRGEDDDLAGTGVEDTEGFRTQDSGALTTSFTWAWSDNGGWLRSQDGSPHVDNDDEQVTVENVVIRVTPYGDSGVRDSRGEVVPEAESVGEGEAWLLSGGKAQRGRWSKSAPDARTEYTDADGEPFRLAPGRTWVEVLPPDSGELVDSTG